MARARDELGVAMAESWRALERVPIADQEWFGPVHPGAAIYRELAREVHVLVESLAPS